jgi:hypothetical protein
LSLQGQERGQIRQDRFGKNGIKKVGAQLRSASHRRSPAFGQRDEFSLVKLEQQRASGHVFELAGGGIPLLFLGQNPRQAMATPKRIGLNQRLNLCDLDATDFAALNNFGFEHAPRLPRGIAGVPY